MDWIYLLRIQIQIMRIFAIWFFYTVLVFSIEKIWKHLKGTKFEIPLKIVGILSSIYHCQTIYEILSWHILVTGIPDPDYFEEGNVALTISPFIISFQHTFSDFDLSNVGFGIPLLYRIFDLGSLGILGLYH